MVDPQPGESVSDALTRYRARPDVLYAEPNRVLHLLDLSPPSDPGYGSQWALDAISALGGWSVFPGTFSPSPSVPVGIVDTGVDATHPDLGNVSGLSATCLNGICTQGVPTDDDGHGTHVSGIAAATTDNGVGVSGLSYASPLIVVRVFSSDASLGAYDSDIANGIAWAASHGAKVINLSLGATGGSYPYTLCNAVELAMNSYGASVVAAAGNGNPPGTPVSTPTWPAACPGAIGVAATDSSDQPASFSNYGNPDVFVSAPGVNVLSTVSGQPVRVYERDVDGVPVRGRARRPDSEPAPGGLGRSGAPDPRARLRQGRRGRVRRRPVRHVRGLHLGGALRLRPHQRPEGTLDGSPPAAASSTVATAPASATASPAARPR